MKTLRKYLLYSLSPFALGLYVCTVISYISFIYYKSGREFSKDDYSLLSLLHQWHEKTIDWRLTDRSFAPGSPRVAILAVDEKAIEQEGRWPWPRDKIAHLIDKAVDQGAKIIAFDAAFPEADQNSSIPSLRRLRHELAQNQSRLTPEMENLISREMERTDGDRFLAEGIARHADHVVMGAVAVDIGQRLPAFQDLCVDALFERSSEARYWKNEVQPLLVVDDSLNRLSFPKEMKERLTEYFTHLEVRAAQTWFNDRGDLMPKIGESLEDLRNLLPPETYPGLATLWLNNDTENAQTLLEAAKPELATPEGAALLFGRFGAAFAKKEAADLNSEVRKAVHDYCGRFLTDRDELLHFDQFKAQWNDSVEARENFAGLNWRDLWPQIQTTRQPAGQAEEFEDAISRIHEHSLFNRILSVERWLVNIPLLARSTKHTGHFNAVLDIDGTVRRSMLLARRGNTYMPSLALKTFLVDKGYNAVVRMKTAKTGRTSMGLESLEVIDAEGQAVMRIPTDDTGQLMIHYSGGSHMFPHVSAADILNDLPMMKIQRQIQDPKTGRWGTIEERVGKKEFLNDKILIFGATAIAVYDLRVTPFEENYPGVETHANALSNLLVEHARLTGERVPASAPGFLRPHPAEERVMWMLLLGLGLVLSALLSSVGSISGLGITAVFMGGVYAIDRFGFFRSGLVTTVIFPMLEIFTTFITLTFYKYFTEERKKRELKGTFEKYVSPAIVAEVLSDPENIELGGKKMELTVMFSDVRGFTSISEKLDPRALSDLLNSYLTPMTALVFKHKGTLDKYMGDAIMAFWGAPIHFKDHAKHGCRCALQMLAKLKALQEEYRARGLPEIDIGIGLNTGEMSVGNMGSETVRSYTVMGDSVNLGSRLEGINKEYGTRIIISEFTHEAVKNTFVTREVDWVRVKGKALPVRIFELISEGPPPADMDAALKHFNLGFALYHERKFAKAIPCFEEALKHKPDDAPAKLYIKRCQGYLEDPPSSDWDGVYNMKSK